MNFKNTLVLALFALGFTGVSVLASLVPPTVAVPFAVGLFGGAYGLAVRCGKHWRELSVVASFSGGLLVGAHLSAGYLAQELLAVFSASGILVLMCARMWAYGASGVVTQNS